MPPQLKRLLPLFAAFVIVFLIVRQLLIPESFGEHGHYRFNSVEDNKIKELHYAGKDMCNDCHEDQAINLASDVHATIACETCHGPGLAHIELETATSIIKPTDRNFCGLCHALSPTRKSNVIVQVDLSDHNIEQLCIECHNPHMPWELKE
ncbi:MAG: hypothetical protein HQ521_14805 [Bacteroidetes bacterium]|nr:hypothetical protein [Bacteroidota bacterium]